MAKIFIRPNPNVNPLLGYINIEEKRTRKDTSGAEIEERELINKRFTRAPGTSFQICANPSRKLHGNLNTGMLELIPNPYKENDDFSDRKLEAVLKGKDKAKKQHILEHKWNKPFNYYTNQWVDTLVVEDKDIPALMKGEYMLELNDGVTILDTTTEYGDIMYCIAQANELIANSYEELNSTTPFYIAKEEEEAERKRKREALQDRCTSYLVNIYDNHQKELYKFCKALDLRKKPSSIDAAYNQLKNYLKAHKDNAKFFQTIYNMWEDETTKPYFLARVMLYDARYHGIILKDGASYTWHPPQTEEGESRESVKFDRFSGDNSIIEFLAHPRYQTEQAEIMEQINRANQYRK